MAKTPYLPKILPIVPLSNGAVLLPGLVLRIQVRRQEIVNLLDHLQRRGEISSATLLGCVPLKRNTPLDRAIAGEEPLKGAKEEPENIKNSRAVVKAGGIDNRNYGCVAKIRRLERMVGGGYLLAVEGLTRFAIDRFVQTEPYIEAEVSYFVEEPLQPSDYAAHGLLSQMKQAAKELLASLRGGVTREAIVLRRLEDYIARADASEAGQLADIMVSALDATPEDKISILEAVNLQSRLERIVGLLNKQLNLLKLSKKISSDVNDKLSKKQREFYLKQQLNAIREELGENGKDGDGEDDVSELTKKIEAAKLPEDANKIAQRELKRLKRMQPQQAEYGVIRTYLETLGEIPWSVSTEDQLDSGTVKRARKQLDDDHYGLDLVKKRLIEYLAVLRLKRQADQKSIDKGPILLLVGPPGTGKTSLAKSVATALGRKFHRISLGGVRDEAEIRGHRRTYVGAMPGLIMQGMKKVAVNNPVVLLDEIDKVSGNNFHGDPSAAMLEVLDPEQNHTFNDHYVNTPYDLSKVLFIATANTLETIAPPLLDRMETISLPGYTLIEKSMIAKQHLLPKQIKSNGLGTEQIDISDEILGKIASSYTREAGVRNLEREIASVCRFKAVEFADLKDSNETGKYVPKVTIEDLERILGVEKFDDEIAERTAKPGVVTGLAYMGTGNGGIMFIEVSEMPGKGTLHLTGKLGDVIKESAHIALSWVKSHAFVLGLTASPHETLLKDRDVHIHCPAGAVSKDGPSAGIAITLALVSLFSQQTVAPNIAMTGEVTLRGNVLAIGGVKEKVIAAHRAGIKTVLLPQRNRKEVVHDLPENVRHDIHFVYARTMWDVLREVWPEYLRNKPSVGISSRL